MKPGIVIFISITYVALLFLIAYYAEKRAKSNKSLVNNSFIYALSMGVYCTAWTYYGSVGRAATTGLGFLPVYIGPVIIAPLWWMVMRKIIFISKNQRITSIADFISSRFGKSTWLGIIATLVAVLGIIPYISIQLKAITTSFELLTGRDDLSVPFYMDSALYIAIALAIFSILFGTRNLDPNERHEGLVAAVAFESLFKLAAFVVVGIFVSFHLFSGFGDLFQQAQEHPEITRLFTLETSGINSWDWFWLSFLSMAAIMLLPRQFHVSVVENTNPDHVGTASWLFPLYLLVINIFVIPIAIAGLLYLPNMEPDHYVLSLPLYSNQSGLALFAALGGFSAATSMVIISVLALSIMIGNNLVLPIILRSTVLEDNIRYNMSGPLLGIRRVSIVVVLLLSYAYFRGVGNQYSLVSVGLISFTAIAQFAPAVMGGIYWKRATKKGALVGLLAGFSIWAYTLPLPTLAEAGLISDGFTIHGPFHIELLKPSMLFGLNTGSAITQAAFWSLLFNTMLFVVVSLNTSQSPLEASQADIFVNIYKYRTAGTEYDVVRRQAKVKDITMLMKRFLGQQRAQILLSYFEQSKGFDLSKQQMANPELINYAETHLGWFYWRRVCQTHHRPNSQRRPH